jgi:hypothetical protein
MNQHLREEDICRWIAGERSRETEQHLGNCGQCRLHVARASDVLGGFHDSVRERGVRRLAGYGALSVSAKATRGWISWSKLPVAALATTLVILLLAVAALLPWHASKSPAVDDAALLKRVDAELSRTVPGPMEPLSALISEER